MRKPSNLNDIFHDCPEAKTLWLANERYRWNRAKINAVHLRITEPHRPLDMRHGYMNALLSLVDHGKLQPRDVKYLTGLSHGAYNVRAAKAGIARLPQYKGLRGCFRHLAA